MKRITLGASFALACAAAVPFALSPHADAASSDAAPGGGHFAALQSPSAAADLKAAAQADAANLVQAVGLSADNTFTVKNVMKDVDGATHVRVDRSFKGLPVVGGDLVIHRDAAGKVIGHDGTFAKDITLSLTPTLTVAQVAPKALAAAQSEKQNFLAGAKSNAPQLVVLLGHDGAQKLGYRTTTSGVAKDSTPSNVVTVVDAHSGATLSSFDTIDLAVDAPSRAVTVSSHRVARVAQAPALSLAASGTGKGIYVGTVTLNTTQSGGQYQLKNPDTGNYTTDSGNKKSDGTTFTDSDNTWGNGSNSDRASAGVDSQYGADMTYAYYKNVLGRNGIWDNGTGARSRVHYDSNYTNAFWDGKQMTYGDGAGNNHPLTELDVSGHEMSHGVNQNTAGLNYEGDAGGLNESNSDIFGTAVEFYANNKVDVPDYLIGETIDLNGDGTPLRYMDKPSKDGVSPDCWTSGVARLDPHQASGPLNHWFYLASEGSGSKTINGVSYNSPTCNRGSVKGASHGNVEKVWYRTMATKLSSNSTYADAREGAIKSATELYGASSQTCWSVQTAFDAISVGKGSASCTGTPTPDPTPSPTGTPTSTPTSTPTGTPTSTPTNNPTTPAPVPGGNAVVNGDFEQGDTAWTGTSGVINDIVRNGNYPSHSGKFKLWLGGNGRTSTEYKQQTITVPAGSPKLTFWYGIDSAENTKYSKYDTATVSVNGKAVASFSNLDETDDYVQKTVDLSAYAGQSVTLKLSATEDSVNQTSFVFDDVAVN